MTNGTPWPRISIVTPSLNQGQYIEETIRSVLLQGYPDLEYIVIDGGSTDGSLDIIRKYDSWLSQWESKPDRGQSHAINRGLEIATGSLANWINSDDILLEGSLGELAVAYHCSPGSMIVGAGLDHEEASGKEILLSPRQITVQSIIRFWEGWFDWLQPSIFFPRSKFLQIGKLDESLHFSMDIDLYCRLMTTVSITHISKAISRFRRHGKAKTRSGYHDMMLEHIKVVSRYKQLLDHHDAKAFGVHTTLFLLRRMKRLLLDGRYHDLIKYLHYTFAISRSQILRTSLDLALSKIRLNRE
jgi:glycosyltransferase involved in cell wall biosynthesis